ncbi:2-aminoethanethiol dioxygenase [Macrosteles quadrilineatus]|uniref:2-aminoethanethiol dioxygenase n=1 Tax=Macrosteles quadrilineatus TaxID=74068 RepID=UPI0023E234E6|nr:2-aminoethanethiol dioxygenase [Macrosteles quadrilineatus]
MAGSSLIEVVKRQAIATFTKLAGGISSNFEDNLSKLTGLMNKVTSDDVNLDECLSSDCSEDANAPVAYINIHDDPNLSIGVFVLKKGARLPLHDHPLMYGILKVIRGTVHIQSYSILTNPDVREQETLSASKSDLHPSEVGLTKDTLYRPVVLLAKKEPASLIGEKDSACVLSPLVGNLHEIHSVNGPAAFLDVLSPSYNTDIPGVGPRPCRYFKELECDTVSQSEIERRPLRKLIRISPPPDYWSCSLPYKGP